MAPYEFDLNRLRNLPGIGGNIGALTELRGGWDSRLFMLDNKVVVKVPRNPIAQLSIRKEKIVTDLLRKEMPLPIPEINLIEIDSIDGDKLELALYKMLPGVELQNIHVIGNSKNKIAKSLGLFLQKLHNTSDELTQDISTRISDINTGRSETDAKLLNSVLQYFEGMKHENNVSSYIEIMQESLAQLKHMEGRIVPCHGDFMSNNILFNETECEISGIIDWGDFSFRNPIYDFAGLTYEFGEQFLDSMLTTYSSKPSADFKEDIMNLSKFVPFITIYFSRNMRRIVRFENGYIKIELSESGRDQILRVG